MLKTHICKADHPSIILKLDLCFNVFRPQSKFSDNDWALGKMES